ncbi:Uu.00g043190.m01.CDS01 [Anthostomella pinea]|uniref:Uu.00g043190.m01.CDS01 n=1 Tax=Anthostomella pinea TaxID=933095 RepID=A0AAI8YE41_9PEZI|nr:Uu.00g043190.m01.CDS01 [Anthostomella pinea]
MEIEQPTRWTDVTKEASTIGAQQSNNKAWGEAWTSEGIALASFPYHDSAPGHD